MRLSPGVGGVLPREVLPGGLHIEGHHFPEGTVVATVIIRSITTKLTTQILSHSNLHAGSRIVIMIQRPQVSK